MVLDASALLALVNAEPGWEQVADALPEAAVSAVNLAEVVAKLADRGVAVEEIHHLLTGLGLVIVPFDAEGAFRAGAMRSIEGGRRLALGDRACLALAHTRGEPAMTADRYWKGLEAGVEVVLIR